MKFSVIIPLYNKVRYISKAIDSIAYQTFDDFELIVIDDGSTDDSYSVASKCLLDHKTDIPRYQIIHQENKGVSTARNNGVAVSEGSFICFLDADDWWEPDFLAEMSSLITDFPDAGIYGCSYYYVKNGKKSVRVSAPRGYINYCATYAARLCMPLTSISVAIPRTIFDEFHGFKSHLRLGEDFDLWIRITLKYKTAFNDKPLANYNQDVEKCSRGIGQLHSPQFHMLWNLDYLSEEENTNHEYKVLIDRIRVYSLLPYYMSKEYHNDAVGILNKVDWSKQPGQLTRLYNMPTWYLRFRQRVLTTGSVCKTFFQVSLPSFLKDFMK